MMLQILLLDRTMHRASIEKNKSPPSLVRRQFQQTQSQRRRLTVVALTATPGRVTKRGGELQPSIALQRSPQR
jgi:hypothetical protein